MRATHETRALPDCGRASTRGLRLRSGLPFDDWQRAGAEISRISSASAWWLGDWVIYGEQAYGTRYRAALEITALDYKTLRNYAWVARRFEVSRRRDTLSFQHHSEVAGLAAAEQDLWLARADRQRWSRNELRRRIAADRARRCQASLRHPLVLRMEVAEAREQRWRDAANCAEQEFADWIARAADEAADAALTTVAELRLDDAAPPERLHISA